jgi:hypothetical protein
VSSPSLDDARRRYSIWGKSLVLIGALLILIGAAYIFFVPIVRECPTGGCPPLTAMQLLGFYWPAIATVLIGIAAEVVGLGFIIKSRSIKSPNPLNSSVDNPDARH